ncbi:hypothetical protein MTP04_24550 [Lysinibacillus sp. PLM2]|nr:hypothetical protein MTP04_24550 [Lysinibacillus sp. PLM2]
MKIGIFTRSVLVFVLGSTVFMDLQTEVDAADYNITFSDISQDSTYYETIHEMVKNGIINGYEDGTFRPLENITRQHAAVLLTSATDLPQTKAFKAFRDVPQEHYYFNQIKAIQMAGIIEADETGAFNANQSITRGEMAKALVIAFNLEVKADYSFKDVPESNEYSEYIKALYSNGVTSGYEDGTFKPNKPLSRAHFALFMNKAMNLDKNYVAEPIEGETSGTNIDVLIEDIIRGGAVPLPDDYTDKYELKEEQVAKATEIKIKEKHTITNNFTVSKSTLDLIGETVDERLSKEAAVLRISVEELVTTIHQVMETGEVYNGGHYSLYFDWTKGLVTTSIRDTTFIK